MNISPLDEIILAADADKCEQFFEAMTEPQRKALAPRALQWVSAVHGCLCRNRKQYMLFDKSMAKDIEFYESIQAHAVIFPTQFTEVSFPVARISVLATGGFPELKKAGALGLPEPLVCARVLKTRKPSWLDKWCAYIIKEFPTSHWLTLHELENSGLCSMERNPGYWMAMLCTLANTEGMYENVLTQDQKVRNELWDMLADQGVIRMLAEPEQIAHEIFRKRWNSGANIFGSTQTGSRKGSEVWRQALIRLASEGLINNERLLEYSFTSLAGAAEKESKKSIYAHSTAEFAIKLNEELTKEKSTSYTSQFASLLGATHKDVSVYASTILSAMPVEKLNAAEICSCIAPAFLNKNKDPADGALKLLGRLAKETASDRCDYGPAILAAFNHSSKDIHKKALTLVQSTRMLEDQKLLGEFRQRLDMLAGLERTNATKLAEQYQGSEDSADNAAAALAPSTNADELFARANALDGKLRALAKIDAAIEATKNNIRLDEPVLLDSLEFPRLNPDTAVKPITNLDDLIYMFTKVWSGKSDALDLEAVLDGVSRLCHERPSDFVQKTDALRQKALKIAQEGSGFGWAGSLTEVAFSWVSESSGYGGPTISSEAGSIFRRRCHAVAKRALVKKSAPLLAAPTHGGGWIDPEVLVKRMVEYFWLKLEPDKVDFIQALLRVAPEKRESACEAASSIKGEQGDALRYALGGSMSAIKTPEYWVAAFRARDPRGTSEELKKLLPNFGPDGAEPATYGFDLEPIAYFAKDRYSSISSGLPDFLPVNSSEPKIPSGEPRNAYQKADDHARQRAIRDKYAFYPTILLHDNSNSWFAGTDSNCWLHHAESMLALTAKRMLQNIESVGTYWHGDFERLFDPDVSMAENGRYVICFAMSSKSNDLARLAVDSLVAAVGECRIGGRHFGEAMAAVIPSGVITPVRWTRGLRDMSRTSPLHAHFTWQAICTLIEKAPINSTQQIPFLELLVELQIEHHFKLDETFIQVLSTSKGEGKAAKLTKTILAAACDDGSTRRAALQDLESRINRVERWQKLHGAKHLRRSSLGGAVR